MVSILVVEDSRDIYEPLCENLASEHYESAVAPTVREAVSLLEDPGRKFDLALIDLQLPDGHGFSVFRVCKDVGIPVIFLTANDDDLMISGAFDMGAADYVPKPYRKRELLARISKALEASGKINKEVVFADLRIDSVKGCAYKNGEELMLSRLEYRLLLLFMNNPGKLYSRDMLFEEIWNITGEYITDNTLTVHIKRLREKIGDEPTSPRYIQTVRGMGYKMGT
ncbi:MAG: response regulator transcription factor [Clostridia bacterium]|nr:response regulator transcription factor [Clostridia bacterium]